MSPEMKIAAILLMTGVAVGQATKPAKPVEPWTACSCAGKECKPPMDNMNGGTAKACKKVGGVWKPVGATVQLIFTPEERAAYPANAWMKPCDPDNYDDACVLELAHPARYATFTFCVRDGDKDCIPVIDTTTDAHGCQEWSGPFEWDEGSQTCRTNVAIAKQPAPVTCSPISAPDADGSQHMVCWYVPKQSGGKP